ncbi:hypothetical protein [Novosphingobium guangzhouense]|uniref:Uncharacterized protein n=1 Tax=Novosphingobium guangzhouense TaxID=1850347 RepID=A0A2K2G0Q7_9SPHN|nr:hypothetical protein [Novosphingobium guangzhouense]PNU04568.1 hypothetical protein A8V01_19340 [Novosphingobium guangzhouense]
MIADDTSHTALVDRKDKEASLYPAWSDAPVQIPDDAAREPSALQDLRDLTQPEADPGYEPEGLYLPLPYGHTTGSQLRRRFVTAQSIAELAHVKKPSLWQRLLGRK